MATKKAAIVKAVDGNDLAKAGIDVKLSKMEIADYIAEKAKEELETRMAALNAEYKKWTEGYLPVIPTKEQQAACDALTKATGKKFYCQLTYNIHNGEDESKNWLVCIGTDTTDWSGRSRYENAVAMKANDSQRPDGVNVIQIIRERSEVFDRLQELGKKKHRTMLLEKILASNESGKKVLADLQGMVARAVNG